MKITDEKKINFRKKVSEKLLTKKACSGTIYEQCESIELYSSIAQPVEHAAVNRRVVGSSPTGGAIKEIPSVRYLFFLFYMRTNQRACAASQPNRHCLARSAQRARRVKQTARCAVCSQSGARSGLDVGSSPTGGAIKEIPSVRYLFFLFYMRTNQRACAASQPNRHCLARSAQRARRVKQTAQCAVCSQSGSQKTWSLVRVQLGEPSVMVYKSFLIDHHFCIFRGIFAPF